MVSIKQIKSDIIGPILYQGASRIERSLDLIWDNTLKEFQINGDVVLLNTSNSNTLHLRAGATANNITYILPITDPTAGQILTASVPVSGVSTLSWSSTAAIITADSGLTKTGSNIQLGGPLLQDTTISASNTYSLVLDSLTYFYTPMMNGTDNSYIYQGPTLFSAGWQDLINGQSTTVIANNNKASIGSLNGAQESYIEVWVSPVAVTNNGSDNNLVVTDQISSKGLVYVIDYSANFTPESLVSKRYVDNSITALTLASVLTGGNTSGGIDILFTAGTGIDTTATGGSDILNIGTTNADVINIGRAGITVNIFGTRTFIQSTDSEIADALIRLNKGGGAATAINTGFEIEENLLVTGYFKTNGTRAGWLVKAPASFEFELDSSTLTASRSYIMPDVNGTIITTGNLPTITLSGDVTGSGTTAITTSILSTVVTGKLLTGYVSGAGVVSPTDSILQAIQKLNGNITALVTGVSSVSGTTNRITSTGGATPSIDIAATYVGQTSITTLGTITTGTWNGTAIANANLANSSITVNGTSISLGASGTVTAAAGTLTGTTLNATVVSSSLTSVGTITTGTWNGSVISSTYGGTGVNNGGRTLTINTSNGTISFTTAVTLTVAATASVSGTNTGDQTTITGNAGTATALQTARNINGVAFDGTANITVTAAAGTLTGTTLNATVVTSSLTSVGTITAGTWNGTAIAAIYGGTGQTVYAVGDILYASTTTALSKLNVGTNGQVLTLTAGIPSWVTPTTGTVTSVTGTTNRITSTGGATPVIDIAATYVGQTSITTLGTITTGVWNGTVINSTYGGTGVNNGGRTLTINTNNGTISFTSAVTLTVAATASVSGTNTGDQTTITGNAGTATALQNARTINGTSFDGTANITVTAAAGTLTGTTLNATVVTSSLTSVGTISTGVWNGTIIDPTYGGTGVNNGSRTLIVNTNSGTIAFASVSSVLTVTSTASISGTNTGDQTTITGNAGTATALQTARTINGTSFDGTANITVTAAAGTLTGTTLNATVVTSSLTSVGTIATGVWNGTVIADSFIATALTGKTYNGLTLTSTTGTFTLTAAKTLSVTNTLTLSGTDGSTISFGAGGTVAYTANNLSVFAATTSAELLSVISDETGTGLLVFNNTPTLINPTLTNNLLFTGTGNRITGDFSTTTFVNRVHVQSSVTNGNTNLGILPNGTATTSGIRAYNNSDPTNAAYIGFSCTTAVANFSSSITGTGTYVPMTFETNGAERLRITLNGGISFGTGGTNYGTTGQTLISAGDAPPVFGTLGVGGGGTGTTTAFTQNSIVFAGIGGIYTQDTSFTYNSTTKQLALTGTDTTLLMTGVTTEPTAPGAGNLLLYSKSIAGRMMPKWLSPSGVDNPLQSGIFFNNVSLIAPGSTTALTTIGALTTNVGTISHPTPTATSLKAQTRRFVNTSAATAGSLASVRVKVMECWRGNTAGLGGFFVVARFSIDTLAAGNRMFVGLTDTATTAPTNIDPTTSTTPGKIGMAINTNTGNWNLVHNVTGATPTVIALGANFPVNTTDFYEFILYAAPNGSTVGYRITNQTTNIQTSGTLSTNLPASTTFLGRTIWMTNNATLAAVAWSCSKFGLETDY